MPLAQVQSSYKEVKQIYQAPADKKISASLSLNSPMGGSFALAISSSALAEGPLDQTIPGLVSNQQLGARTAVSRDGVWLAVTAAAANGIAIYKRVNGVYSRVQVVTNPDGNANPPIAISADGSRLVSGNVNQINGGVVAVYTYTRTGDVFTQVGTIVAAATSSRPSYSVAITGDGNTVVMGDPTNSAVNANGGRVTTAPFTGNPTATSVFNGPGASGTGISVAVTDNGRIVAGAFGRTNAVFGTGVADVIGQVFYFTLTGAVQLSLLDPGGNAANGFGFGVSVSADGKVLAVGSNVGSYIYQANHVSDGTPLSRPGYARTGAVLVGANVFPGSVSPSGNNVFVSVAGAGLLELNNNAAGAVYRYRMDASRSYVLASTFGASDNAQAGMLFGSSISALDFTDGSEIVVVGAPEFDTSTLSNPGALFAFNNPPTGVLSDDVRLVANQTFEKTGLVLEPNDRLYLINRGFTTASATLVGYSEKP